MFSHTAFLLLYSFALDIIFAKTFFSINAHGRQKGHDDRHKSTELFFIYLNGNNRDCAVVIRPQKSKSPLNQQISLFFKHSKLPDYFQISLLFMLCFHKSQHE